MFAPLFALLLLLPLATPPATAPEPVAPAQVAEFVFRNATIYDGTGQPPVVGDVHVRGERIVAVGKVGKTEGATEVDASRWYACPGFIDLHTHCDPGLTGKGGRANKNYVTQGCTTVVTGNCGSGPTDVASFFKTLQEQGVGTNVIHLAPHNSIRARVMGNSNRPPTADELRKMESLVDQAMKDGAWGLSTGLIYNPGTYAKTDEIIALARVAARHGGLYASHIRNESGGLLDAIEEAVAIGREAGCRVHISHIKASGQGVWGRSTDAVALIERYRRAGREITADQYPYTASSTSLRATLVPAKYREGTEKDFVARLEDPKIGPALKADIAKALGGRDGGKRIQIARYSAKPQWQGKNLAAIAEAEGRDVTDIVLEIERHGGAAVVNFAMSEDDVRVYMRQSWVATASDGGVQIPGDSVPHPRSYGTFPRKIGYYAIQEKLIPVEAAIRSASGLPADILRLTDRGYLKPGYFADLVIFDPASYRDTATYDKPHQYATGVKWVLINGRPAVRDGKYLDGVYAGRVLKWKGQAPAPGH
jgi:N-acyl-D-amino-acid deacylase